MLILTRKVGDVVAIGDNIKIIVMSIKGKQVRLGIQADKNTVVHREEIYQKILMETKEAMTTDVGVMSSAKDLLTTESSLQNNTPPGFERSTLQVGGNKTHIIRRKSTTEDPQE